MNINQGKIAFDQIEIPNELGNTVERGLRRGKKNRALRHGLGSFAAMVALAFFIANVPTLYARATEIPLFAPIVRIMHVGSGGEETSGVVGKVQAEKNKVRIVFEAGKGVPPFSSAVRKIPHRVTLRLHGLMEKQPLLISEALLKQDGITEAYALSTTDPEEQGVIFHLAPGWNCAIVQYENFLELQMFQNEFSDKEGGYVLCSESMPAGQQLAELTEALLWEGATQLRFSPEDYRVVVGEYRTEEQAKQAQQGIQQTKGIDLGILYIPAE